MDVPGQDRQWDPNKGKAQPGPASTVVERPPTNPAIRVRFRPEADDISFSSCLNVHNFIRDPDLSNYSLQRKKAKAPSTGNESSLQFSLCMKRNVATNWSYGT